jgi:hypothetical protein
VSPREPLDRDAAKPRELVFQQLGVPGKSLERVLDVAVQQGSELAELLDGGFKLVERFNGCAIFYAVMPSTRYWKKLSLTRSKPRSRSSSFN